MTAFSNTAIYYRLVALWVLCEAMLGGIIHGFRIPVSGLVVGSCAVICIALIAWFQPSKGSIVKATLIVAIFKMMLSPQAPLPAYFAVFFQGLLGELFFWRRKFFTTACILFGTLALLESGLQRIAVLTLVYGNDLWKAINEFLNGLTGQATTTNYSFILGAAYVLLHVVAGFLVGLWVGRLPHRLYDWERKYPVQSQIVVQLKIEPRKRKRLKKGLLIIWIILLLLYIQSEFMIGPPLLPSSISLRIFIRSVIIVLSWYFLVGPLLKQLLIKWLQKKQQGLKDETRQIFDLIPVTKEIIQISWEYSGQKKGFQRIGLFGKAVLANLLTFSNKITILTGPVGTGKTTSLLNWSGNKNDVFGILSPVIEGKRYFLNIQTREKWPMEVEEKETAVLQVGRYVFSKKNFDAAIDVLNSVKNESGWLVIDELGPLELRGEGFYAIMNEILSERRNKLLLVVRENLVDEMVKKLNLQDPVIISDISQIKEI